VGVVMVWKRRLGREDFPTGKQRYLNLAGHVLCDLPELSPHLAFIS
jgi:hypothetical protein